jgi:ketosteroid isomerase-like protein
MKNLLIALFILSISTPALSQTAPPEDPVHNELRALRDGLQDAIKKGDIERELSYLHPNVVVTWQNAEVSRGRDGVRKYLNKILSGPAKSVKSYRTEVTVDELTALHGANTGIAYGSSNDHFEMIGGTSVDFTGRWSATLIKEDGKWLIGSFHASSNLFDNPMLAMAQKLSYIIGILGLIGGLVIGYLFGRRRKAAA